MYKFAVIAALVACANAGLVAPVAYGAAYGTGYGSVVSPAIGSQTQSVARSLDGGSAISQYSKAVDTAFSSVRKYDTRITNDARYLAAAPVATYAAAPVATYAHAAPVATYAHAAPVATYAHAAPVAHAGLLGVAYSAAPVVSHISFDGLGAHYAW